MQIHAKMYMTTFDSQTYMLEWYANGIGNENPGYIYGL